MLTHIRACAYDARALLIILRLVPGRVPAEEAEQWSLTFVEHVTWVVFLCYYV